MKRKKNVLHIVLILLAGLAGIALLRVGIIQASETIAKSRSIDMDAAKNFCFIDAQVTEDDVLHLEIEFERENGQYVYEVSFDTAAAHYGYDVNASDGTILFSQSEEFSAAEQIDKEAEEVQTDREMEEKKQDDIAPPQSEEQKKTYISVSRAKSLAVKNSGLTLSEVTFSETKLEEDDGRMLYEIEFYTVDMDYEYKLDPWNGKILEMSVKKLGEDPVSGDQVPIPAMSVVTPTMDTVSAPPEAEKKSADSGRSVYKPDDDRDDDDWEDDDREDDRDDDREDDDRKDDDWDDDDDD